MSETATPAGSTRLRNVTSKVVTGADGPALEAALNAFTADAGEAVLLAMLRVAEWAVLIVYAT